MLSSANISLGISFEYRKARRPLNLDEKHTNTSNEGGLRIDYPFDHIVAENITKKYGIMHLSS